MLSIIKLRTLSLVALATCRNQTEKSETMRFASHRGVQRHWPGGCQQSGDRPMLAWL